MTEALVANEVNPAFPYRIEEKVGEGGMGVVYRAIEPDLGRLVAIKRLRPELLASPDPQVAADSRQRFLREARAAAALSHPGVTSIYRVGEDEEGPFIAMEWLDGVSFEVLLERRTLTIAEAVRHAIALLEALDAAHRSGVVHRDIKPANLVVLKDGRLKVTDFGIARMGGLDPFRTQAGLVLASPRFASPEQLLGDEVDGRSDIFSSGVVLYLALTGRGPFEGDNAMDLVSALLRDAPTPLREINPAIPEGLEAAVLRALRRRREERYERAAEMAEAMRPFATPGWPGSTSGALLPVPERASSTTSVALRGVPREAAELIARVAADWPARTLGRQAVEATLARLLERPLHAEPFAGLARFGRVVVLLHDGVLVGALDTTSRKVGDEVLESLPPHADATIHRVPATLPPAVVDLLASLLHSPRVRQGDLDSSFVSLPALARKLAEERFDGILRLVRGEATGFLLLSAGQTVLSLFTDGWEDVPTSAPWETWISRVSVKASIEERNVPALAFSLRRELRDQEVSVDPAGSTLLAVASEPGLESTVPADADPSFRMLGWALQALPRFFQERGRSERWKYLVEWLPLVRRARLHHELPRPDETGHDAFDLVTFDAGGKVLHLGHRLARVGQREVKEFAERVSRAKLARQKTGDVGAAILVSPAFDSPALTAYQALVGGTGRWGIEEALTRYEGFVRLGPRRGFHLLLVRELPGGFEPILPR